MSRRLEDLHPYVRFLTERLLAECERQGVKVQITHTLRTMQEQNELYAQGRTKPGKKVTNAKAGQSMHNYGLAIDFVPIVGGKAAWDRADLFRKVGAIGVGLGFTWGGNFKTIKDMPHFEYTFGLTTSQLQAGKRPPAFDYNKLKQQEAVQKVVAVVSQNISEWAKEDVELMKKLGVIKGDAKGNINPQNAVTVEQMCVFMSRLYKLVSK